MYIYIYIYICICIPIKYKALFIIPLFLVWGWCFHHGKQIKPEERNENQDSYNAYKEHAPVLAHCMQYALAMSGTTLSRHRYRYLRCSEESSLVFNEGVDLPIQALHEFTGGSMGFSSEKCEDTRRWGTKRCVCESMCRREVRL